MFLDESDFNSLINAVVMLSSLEVLADSRKPDSDSFPSITGKQKATLINKSKSITRKIPVKIIVLYSFVVSSVDI